MDDKAGKQIAVLERIVTKYADHRVGCPKWIKAATSDRKCICEFDEAMAELSKL